MLEMLVRRVDNRIDVFDCNIALDKLEGLAVWKNAFKQ
jgi:hypothetical protein